MLSKLKIANQGFTLIELLIVIVIIAILAVGAFVALDPATRFKDSRDSRRWTDVTAVLEAAKVHQVDNGGSYLAVINALNNGSSYRIGTDTGGACSDACTKASPVVIGCVDLDDTPTANAGLAEQGYLASIPIAPSVPGGIARSAGETGYYMRKAANGSLTVGACDVENTTNISVSR